MSETFALPGLSGPAEIRIDASGLAHIQAGSTLDAFRVQGFNAARDRLWQLDLWRKRGLGLLAADFGPGFIAQDRAARLFLYRGDMAAEWAAYGPQDTKAIVTAFVGGLNAFIALTDRRPDLLPPEFARMGTRPALGRRRMWCESAAMGWCGTCRRKWPARKSSRAGAGMPWTICASD